MLIALDNSIGDDLVNLTENEWLALENIAICGSRGEHLVICPSATAHKLACCTKFSDRQRAFYRSLASKYATQASIRDQVIFYVVLRPGSCGPLKETISRQTILTLDLHTFSNPDFTAPSKLIGEEVSDCKWLEAAARCYIRNSSLRGMKLKMELVAGHGSNTATTLEEVIKFTNRFALCVVDTDVKPTNWKQGETANKVLEIIEKHPCHRVLVKILQCHELENLTPTELLVGHDSVIPPQNIKTRERLSQIFDLGHHHITLFLDLKKGLKAKDVINLASCTKSAAVWTPLLSSINNESIEGASAWLSCTSGGKCTSSEACACVVLEPLGAIFLEKATEHWNRSANAWKSLPGHLLAPLTEICEAIAAWGCGLPQQVA